MKYIYLLLVLIVVLVSCDRGKDSGGCTYNGHILYVGEKGGCYYLSTGGKKEYVDKSYCNGCN
ncbi:hypothetical protein CMU59_09125 [Elizabethkingia anophelis]|nr:hypothetical protein AS358_10205 [Elizabethkingia anophelis]MCW2462296.1 hypothetical protein [Elizabethkingia anophelis]MCW2465980.1 hypothetical protein [Elizabethkingia anophelis]MCW2469665.1 hypothetical protein [Elizabethkingia anophelis]MDV3550132.1 hypothetical protein [Elizabethkingia anophelis]